MSAKTKSNISVWKINKDSVFFNKVSRHEDVLKKSGEPSESELYISHIIKESTKGLKQINTPNQDIEGKKMKVFYSNRVSFGLYGFLGEYVSVDQKRKFKNDNHDIVIFLYDEKDIFCITSGSAYHAISHYSDDDFPLELGKRIFSGSFSKANARVITGSVYAESDHFRGGAYSFSRREGFGKVWKELVGDIDKSVIKNSPVLSEILENKRNTSLGVKSNVVFKKSLELSEIISLIEEIQSILNKDLSAKRKKRFAFLETLKKINDEELIRDLDQALIDDLYGHFKTNNDIELDKKDFSYFKGDDGFLKYISAEKYYLENEEYMVSNDYTPRPSDVFNFLRKSGLVKLDTKDQFKVALENVPFCFSSEGENPISQKLLTYFQGEVVHSKTTYFLIDGYYYRSSNDFLDSLKDDFIDMYFKSGNNLKTPIPFMPWKKNTRNEGGYNSLQSKEDNFFHGDQIFYTNGNRGMIEIFDLLYFEKNNDGKNILYIIHVKKGFNGCMRDACSQLRMAAEAIEEEALSDTFLGEYYKKWILHENNNLSKEKFVDMFKKSERKYVLAPAVKSFTLTDFKNDVLYSHISKFEAIELMKYFRAQGKELFLQDIKYVGD